MRIVEGSLVAVEGVDGAGTTTLISGLVEWLRIRSVGVESTHEPSSGPIGAVIRLAIDQRLKFSGEILALLFAADRLDHLENPVNGMLRELLRGNWVVTDRYVASSFAYQGEAGGPEAFQWLAELNRHIRQPDLTIFVDTDIDVCLERIAKRSGRDELFHRRDALVAARDRYLRVLAEFNVTGEVLVVDGNRSRDEVLADVVERSQVWTELVSGYLDKQ
ncbi:dTMP kinase [Rhodococcus erythropolis]|nr:dTMP kinase [Rhodococcus erythropolis]